MHYRVEMVLYLKFVLIVFLFMSQNQANSKNITINFGPQHPAAHGVLRLILELDG